MALITDFFSWVERDITRFGSSGDHVQIDLDGDQEKGSSKIHIYTDTNRYTIFARNPRPQYREVSPPEMPDDRGSVEPRPSNLSDRYDAGYLGCIASSRKPRAGETWQRGSDLGDGPLMEETWHKILGDIVSYEMVRVHPKPQFPQPDRDAGTFGSLGGNDY